MAGGRTAVNFRWFMNVLVLAMPVWDQVVSLLSELKLLTVHMKRINPIKMLFPSIHPPYISWFYLNQFNFF